MVACLIYIPIFLLESNLNQILCKFLAFFVLWVLSWQLIAQTFQFTQLLELLKILEKSATFRNALFVTTFIIWYHFQIIMNFAQKNISKFISTIPFIATKTHKTKWTININEWWLDIWNYQKTIHWNSWHKQLIPTYHILGIFLPMYNYGSKRCIIWWFSMP